MATEGVYGADPGYIMGKRKVEDTYALQTAGNKYQKSVLGRDYAQQQDQMARQAQQSRNSLGWGAAARGMTHSSNYNQQLANWAYNRNLSTSQAAQQYADAMFGNTQNQALLEQGRSRDLESLDLSEAQRIAALAAQLRSVG